MAGWLILCLAAFTLFPQIALSDVQSLHDAYAYRAAAKPDLQMVSKSDVSYEDGSIKTKSVDAKEVDQRYVVSTLAYAGAQLNPSACFKLAIFGLFRDGLKQDTVSTDRKVSFRESEAGGSLDLGYKLNTDINVMAGLGLLHLPKSTKTVKSDTLNSETSYEAITFYSPRFSVLKSTSLFTAGLFFQKGLEKKRTYARNTALASEAGEKYETMASEFGLTGRVWLGTGSEFSAELIFAKLSASDEKTEQGSPINKDFFKVRFGTMQSILANAFTLGANLAYRSANYADQGFMSFENIAKTKIESFAVFNAVPLNPALGLGFEIAQDKQSTPELNAEFLWLAYSLTLSVGHKL
jgi:hypothetical protein